MNFVGRTSSIRYVLLVPLALSCGGRSASEALDLEGAVAPSAGGAPNATAPGRLSPGGTGPTSMSATGTASMTGGTLSVGGMLSVGTSSGGAPVVATSTEPPPCSLLIDDMEDGSGHIRRCVERQGVWYAFHESEYGTQWPLPTVPGVPIETSVIEGGRNGSLRAMHSYAAGKNDFLAGIGIDLAFDGLSYGTYDASAYSGVTFWVKGTASPGLVFRVSTRATTLPAYGGVCLEEYCFPVSTPIALSAQWRQIWVPFAAFGANGNGDFPRSDVTNMQLVCEVSCESYDFWIDDLALYAGNPSCCSSPPAGCTGKVSLQNALLGDVLGVGNTSSCEACTVNDLNLDRGTVSTPPSTSLAGLACFSNLTHLSSTRRTLGELSALSTLRELQSAELRSTGQSDFCALSALPQLRTLDISSNQITASTGLIGNWSLTKLSVASNGLQEWTAAIQMPFLEELNASNNALVSIASMGALTSLRKLNLSNNAIVDLAPLAKLTNLTSLDLSLNQIVDLTPLAELKNLSELTLSSNRIKDLRPLAALLNVPKLNLSHNAIEDATGLPVNLTELDLDANQLTSVVSLAPLQRLTRLYIGQNQVTDLSPLETLNSLKTLGVRLNGGTANCPQQSVTIAALRARGVSVSTDCP